MHFARKCQFFPSTRDPETSTRNWLIRQQIHLSFKWNIKIEQSSSINHWRVRRVPTERFQIFKWNLKTQQHSEVESLIECKVRTITELIVTKISYLGAQLPGIVSLIWKSQKCQCDDIDIIRERKETPHRIRIKVLEY